MKKYFRALIRSFHDPAQYREALSEWKGIAGLYAFVMGWIMAFFMVITIGIALTRFQTTMLPQLLEKLPEIRVTHGEVFIRNGPEGPIEIQYEIGRIMIDTERAENEFHNVPDLLFGVGRDFIIIKTKHGLQSSPIGEDKNFIVNRQMLEKFFSGQYFYALLMIFPVLAIGQFFLYLLQMFGVALISYTVTAFLREEYAFEARMRLGALALTPPTVLTILLSLLGHQASFWLTPLIAALYIYAMILMMRRLPSQKVE